MPAKPKALAKSKVVPNTSLIPKPLWDAYVAQRANAEAWAASMAATRKKIEQVMGDNERGVLADGTLVVDWIHGKTNRFSQKKFAADHPEMLELYKEISETRTFNVPGYVKDAEGGE